MLKPTPPAVPCNPIIGHLIPFARRRHDFIKDCMDELGPVFSLKILGGHMAVLIGPQYHQLFFNETDNKLDMHETYKFMADSFGEIPYGISQEVYNRQRPLLTRALNKGRIAGFTGIMQEEIQCSLDNLDEQGEVCLNELMMEIGQNISAHALMGKHFRDAMSDEFWKLYRVISKAMDPLLPSYLPLPKFIRRNRAGKKLHALMTPMIAERRANPGNYDDVLQEFINMQTYEDGTAIEDEALISLILLIVFGGHETTGAHAAWSIIDLLRNPDFLHNTVCPEIDALAPGKPMDMDLINQYLPYTSWAVQESSRLHPATDMLMRSAQEEIELENYRIPKGWKVMVSATVAHRSADVFEQPDHYDPLRFSRHGNNGCPHRNALIGFGGGSHRCLGVNFAEVEMTLIVALMFQQFDLELITTDPKALFGLGVSRPEDTFVRYRRKSRTDHPANNNNGLVL